MKTYVALLRAVNLAGQKPVAMAALRELFTALGFADARPLLQSGNVVFRVRTLASGKLETLLETEADKRLGLQTDFFVRTADEWRTVIGRNPLPNEARLDPSHLVVLFLKDAPAPAQIKALQAAITGREVVRTVGKQAYVSYPDGIGRSRLTNALLERKLGTRSTGRNWNTVLKLGALATPGATA